LTASLIEAFFSEGLTLVQIAEGTIVFSGSMLQVIATKRYSGTHY
jgi:hypothetical protein